MAANPAAPGLLIVCESPQALEVADRAASDVPDRVTFSDLEDAAMRLELGLVKVALVVSSAWSQIALLTRRRTTYTIIGLVADANGEWACGALAAGADAFLASSEPDDVRALLACMAGLAPA